VGSVSGSFLLRFIAWLSHIACNSAAFGAASATDPPASRALSSLQCLVVHVFPTTWWNVFPLYIICGCLSQIQTCRWYSLLHIGRELLVVHIKCNLTVCATTVSILNYLLTFLLNYLLTHLVTYLPAYLLTYLLTYLVTYLLAYLLNCLLTYLVTYLLAYFLTYLLSHSLT